MGTVVTILVAYLIVNNYKPQTVLFLGGIILMFLTIIFGLGPILPEDTTTGLIWFDIFEFMKNTFSSRAAGLGLIIMTVAGFANYMDHIGASKVLVKLAVKPLSKLNAPYIVLAAGYILGQILNIFIPSASGLGVLLMLTMYPILVSLGVSKLAATAMIGTASCLDLGPGSGNANLAAKTAEMDVSVYFAKYQVPVAIVVMMVIAVLHYLVQKWFDKNAGHVIKVTAQQAAATDEEENLPPTIYAILPILPLVLILAFSELFISSIKMDVITAMLICIFVSLMFEVIRLKDIKKVFASIQVFFDGMGTQFARVVTLVVAGEVFAHGLKTIGAIDSIIDAAQSMGSGSTVMILVMVGIITVASIVMGSGNAPFFAFAALAPDVAGKMAIAPVLMLLPMQFAAGIARSVSPITAVIVAVAGISEVSTFDVVKRTAIPMAGALLATIIANFILL